MNGNLPAGLAKAGLAKVGLAKAGLAKAGLAKAGLAKAGLAKVGDPLFVNKALNAMPVAWAGKKHSTITGTPGFVSAHLMSNGPALKRRRTSGFPAAEYEETE